MTTIGQRVAELRRMSGASAMELGALAGLSRSAVSMIETGARPDPAGSTVAALGAVLGDSAYYLLYGKRQPTQRAVAGGLLMARKGRAA